MSRYIPVTIAIAFCIVSFNANSFVLKDWSAQNWTADALRIEGTFVDVWMDRARFVAAVYCEGRYLGNLDALLKPNGTFVGYVHGGGCNGKVSLERMGLAANDAMYPVTPSETL